MVGGSFGPHRGKPASRYRGECLWNAMGVMIPSDKLELNIYRRVKLANAFEGYPTAWADLSAALGHPDSGTLLHLLREMREQERLEIKKWIGMGLLEYREAKLTDNLFFFSGDFRLFLTAKGQ